MELAQKYFALKKSTLFLLIISGHLILTWLSGVLLINEIVFYNTYSEQLTYERAIALFENTKRLSWIGYVILPVLLLIKITLISTVIFIGLFLMDNSNLVTFGKIFGVVIACELVFILAGFSKLLWFCFFAGNYDMNELTFFYPLALSNFFNFSDIDRIWVFPLQTLNLFQFAYILFLSLGLQIRSGVPRAVAEKSVLISYLPGLILIISLIMFLSIGKSI